MALPPRFVRGPNNFTESNQIETHTISEVLGTNTNLSFSDDFMEKMAINLNLYYTPLLIVLGCIGNLLSIVVFYKTKLRVQSTSQYLSALALSDTLFLCQLLPPWLKTVSASKLFAREGYCQLFVYLSYVSSNLSSWLVVAFTIERFVAVVYPLRRNSMCTVKRARHIITSLTAAAILVNLPVLKFAATDGESCNIDEDLMSHAARFNLFDTMLSFTLPLALIVVLNSWIMVSVYRVGGFRGNQPRQPQDPEARPPRPSPSQRSQQRVTRMLLIVSSVFVLLNLPAYTMRLVAYAKNLNENDYSGKMAALQQICLLFFHTNFGINFVLYCLTGQNFRRALWNMCPWLWRCLCVERESGTDRHAQGSSFSTSYAPTEATTSFGVPMPEPSGGRHQRGRRDVDVIQRWRFDNSRQRARESIEMQHLSSRVARRMASTSPLSSPLWTTSRNIPQVTMDPRDCGCIICDDLYGEILIQEGVPHRHCFQLQKISGRNRQLKLTSKV